MEFGKFGIWDWDLGWILENSGFGIGIWDGVWKIWDLGLGFGIEFEKFGIWDWDLGPECRPLPIRDPLKKLLDHFIFGLHAINYTFRLG